MKAKERPPVPRDYYEDKIKEAKEIAFKAGIKEVVDFQREIGVIGFGFDAGTEEEEKDQRLKWSLQLKKWGL
ncbi:hypothetical protein LCGC14_2758180 [marine sediment metagenome]|uniref:Uncharacterized protein n=1 Tax=marine sediment metagenome TaxID=412755 RepID=A0A0F8YZU2_9ZZZZ